MDKAIMKDLLDILEGLCDRVRIAERYSKIDNNFSIETEDGWCYVDEGIYKIDQLRIKLGLETCRTKYKDPSSSNTDFNKFLDEASKKVENWLEWKKNVLGSISSFESGGALNINEKTIDQIKSKDSKVE